MQYYDDQEKELIESFEKSKWTSLKGKKKTLSTKENQIRDDCCIIRNLKNYRQE